MLGGVGAFFARLRRAKNRALRGFRPRGARAAPRPFNPWREEKDLIFFFLTFSTLRFLYLCL
jgi:hypothetical protein